MTVKLTGAQWNQFVHEPWPDSWWIEDEEVKVNGVIDLDGPAGIVDTDIISITGGYVIREGDGARDPERFEYFLKKWLKKQTEAFLSVSCPKDKVKEVTAAIVAAGGKVNK